MIGWVIDRDYLAEGDEPTRIGYGMVDGDEHGTGLFGRNVTVTTGLRAADVPDPVRFRVLDDDGEVYYGGAIARSWLDGDEERAFAPLTFAAADAGAIDLQYRNAEGEWETL